MSIVDPSAAPATSKAGIDQARQPVDPASVTLQTVPVDITAAMVSRLREQRS